MTYEIQLATFQGPLDLLYQLVKKDKIEISEISLAQVSEQYLDYLKRLNVFDFDTASEFMVIASELIEMKVRTLLPQSDDNTTNEKEDKKANLVQRLKEYDLFKKISTLLREYEEKAGHFFSRPVTNSYSNEEGELELAVDLTDLINAYKKVLSSSQEEKNSDKAFEDKFSQLNFTEVNIQEKIDYIMSRLIESNRRVSFFELISEKSGTVEIVVTFLGILELAKMCKLKIIQDSQFAKIDLIKRTG